MICETNFSSNSAAQKKFVNRETTFLPLSLVVPVRTHPALVNSENASLEPSVTLSVRIHTHQFLVYLFGVMSAVLAPQVSESVYLVPNGGSSKRYEGSRWTKSERRRLRPGDVRG